jgi:hypothetical protein
MQINNLPPVFKHLAFLRRKEYGFPEAEQNDVQSLWCAFDWKRTPEGAQFWDFVDDRKYNHAMKILNKLTNATQAPHTRPEDIHRASY